VVRPRWWLAASSSLFLLTPAIASAGLTFEEGIASNPDSHAELYREQHWLRSDGDHPTERLVLYRCPDGTLFGRKQVDYRQSATAPAFHFEDSRSGYREGLRQGATPTVFVRSSSGAPEKSAALSPQQLVVDAGFDEFIREHWQPLLAGRAVPLDFAVPARLESIGFTVRRIGQLQIAGEPAWIFRLQLGGLLGWLVPHIDVFYGQASRRLLRFEGLSNLRDDQGDAQLTTRIDFASPPRAAAEAQWQAGLQAPLSACKTGQ